MTTPDPADVVVQSLTSAAADGRTIDRPEIAAAQVVADLAAAGLRIAPDDSYGVMAERLDATWTAIVDGWRLMGDGHVIAGIEHLADYMNGCDAVDNESVEQFDRMMTVIRPLVSHPEPDDTTRREVETKTACKGFQWIGQSFQHCEGCGLPAWEHDFDERLDPSAGPFENKWVYVPWTEANVADWHRQGLIDDERLNDMVCRAATYLEGDV